jgi:hypothetical protein
MQTQATIGAGMCQNTYSLPSPADTGGYPHLALIPAHDGTPASLALQDER